MFGRRKAKKLYWVTALVVLSCVSIGCAKTQPAAEKKPEPTLKIAVMPFIHSLPTSFLVEKGWDRKAGFKANMLTFVSGPPMNEALAAGEWEIGNMGIACLTAAARYGAKIVGVICDSAWGQNIWVRPDSPIAKVKGYNPNYPQVYGSPDTVRGKTILLPVATVGHYDVLQWLKVIGVSESEVKIVHMEVPQILPAFEAGQGDIAFLWSPQSYAAADKGWVKVAEAKDLGVVCPDVIVASKKAVEENPDLLATYMAEFYRAIDELKRDQQNAFVLLKAWFEKHGSKIEDKWIKAELENRPYFTVDKALTAFEKKPGAPSDIEKWLGAQAEFMVVSGKLKAEDKQAALASITGDILKRAAEKMKK